jgi:hypothetical protein
MAKCVRCGAETCLYICGTPVCPACDEKKAETTAPEPKQQEAAVQQQRA